MLFIYLFWKMVSKLKGKLQWKLKKQLTCTGNIDCPPQRESDLGESLKSIKIKDFKKLLSLEL